MRAEAQVQVNAPREAVWKVITDIENAVENIGAIEQVEILEKPESGLVGLKWQETRTMFGKTAVETMWITEAVENQSYETRAESHGSVYISKLSISEDADGSLLQMSFKGEAQTFGGKIMSAIFGLFFQGATCKALQQDLEDIKAVVEGDG